MSNSLRTLLLLALLVICLVAGARVALPLYDSYEANAIHYRQTGEVERLLAAEVAPAPLDGKYPCVVASVTDSTLQTKLKQCDLPSRSGPVDLFETDLRYGRFVLRQSDLYVNDVFDVPLTRTYNSDDYLRENHVHAFGRNTNHPFDIAPVGSRYPYTYQMLVFEDGNFVFSPRVSQGTSFADAVYQHTETSSAFYKAVTTWNGNGWNFWRTDGSLIVFPEAYNSKNTAQGAPTEMRDGKGNTLQLLRDEERNLQQIVTPHKHFIKFLYDDESRIIRAEDDLGHSSEYTYDFNGMLTDVISSTGRERHYSYDRDLMTSVSDEKRLVLLRNSYAENTLVRQEFSNGEVYSYSYTPSAQGPYAESVDVTGPDGTTTHVEVSNTIPDVLKHPPQ